MLLKQVLVCKQTAFNFGQSPSFCLNQNFVFVLLPNIFSRLRKNRCQMSSLAKMSPFLSQKCSQDIELEEIEIFRTQLKKPFPFHLSSLSLSLSHTHTHTHCRCVFALFPEC